MIQEVYLPNVHWFAMKNLFTGSCGMLRFKAEPKVVMATAKEVDYEKSSIFCEFWHGLLCYDKSEIEGSQEFSMSEDGIREMKMWLEAQI